MTAAPGGTLSHNTHPALGNRESTLKGPESLSIGIICYTAVDDGCTAPLYRLARIPALSHSLGCKSYVAFSCLRTQQSRLSCSG